MKLTYSHCKTDRRQSLIFCKVKSEHSDFMLKYFCGIQCRTTLLKPIEFGFNRRATKRSASPVLRKVKSAIFGGRTKSCGGKCAASPERMDMSLEIDPLAGKFPNMSPYNYCAGNPVKFIDPDGKYIILVIRGPERKDDVMIQYKGGKLYNMDGSAYKSGPLTGHSTNFKNSLNKIRGADARLEKVVSTLEKSSNKHFIEFTSDESRTSNVVPNIVEGQFKLNSTGCVQQISATSSYFQL